MGFRIVSVALLSLLGCWIYTLGLQPIYAYQGFRAVVWDAPSILLFIAWTGLAVATLPRRVELPSDLFLTVYILICFLWGGSLWQITGLLSYQEAVALMALLFLPVVSVMAVRRFVAPDADRYILPVYLFGPRWLVLPLVAILAASTLVSYLLIGHGDFGLDSVYVRRLEGRDLLAGQVLAGYLINMGTNGVAPVLAFIAGLRRSVSLFLLTIAYVVLLYWLLGLKSPVLNVMVLGGIGILAGVAPLWRHVVPLMLSGLLIFYAGVSWQVRSGAYSALADYVIRRISVVQPQVQSYYVDLFFQQDSPAAILSGVPLQNHDDITFLIGDKYMGNVQSNANTDGFLYALLKFGISGYAMALAVVSGFLWAIDALYKRSRHREYVAIAGLYGILVSEQAYTTALLSSGIFVCFALIVLYSRPRWERQARPALEGSHGS